MRRQRYFSDGISEEFSICWPSCRNCVWLQRTSHFCSRVQSRYSRVAELGVSTVLEDAAVEGLGGARVRDTAS
jgi:hypothetical protein